MNHFIIKQFLPLKQIHLFSQAKKKIKKIKASRGVLDQSDNAFSSGYANISNPLVSEPEEFYLG